jgi:hypothetical protein
MMKIEYELKAKPNAYGFGNDWNLEFKRGNQIIKTFWLGQDVKVVSRLLGLRMDALKKYYKDKYGSENFDIIKEYIAADIIRAVLKTQRITQEQLEKLVLLNSWELAVE